VFYNTENESTESTCARRRLQSLLSKRRQSEAVGLLLLISFRAVVAHIQFLASFVARLLVAADAQLLATFMVSMSSSLGAIICRYGIFFWCTSTVGV
jgi:hypothetical protein